MIKGNQSLKLPGYFCNTKTKLTFTYMVLCMCYGSHYSQITQIIKLGPDFRSGNLNLEPHLLLSCFLWFSQHFAVQVIGSDPLLLIFNPVLDFQSILLNNFINHLLHSGHYVAKETLLHSEYEITVCMTDKQGAYFSFSFFFFQKQHKYCNRSSQRYCGDMEPSQGECVGRLRPLLRENDV